MNRCALFVFVLALLLQACTTLPDITGHRIVRLERPSSDPNLWIALTNNSIYTLNVQRVELIGVDDPSIAEQAKNDWQPGEIWLLQLKEAFDCRIPIQVKVMYEYRKSKDQRWQRPSNPAQVALSGIPTALPLSSLSKCQNDQTAPAVSTEGN